MDDFGGRLRQARERRGISLRQIAASTKISAAALEALERNNISKLPGGIFSRAFVRSYAIEVGLDPDETVREFLERFNQEPPPTVETGAAAIPEEEREFQERRRKAARAALAAAAVIAVLIIVVVVAYRARVRVRAVPPQQAAQDASAPSARITPRAVELPVAPADAGQPSAAMPAKAVEKAPPRTDRVQLEIHPTAACWVSVTADGKKLFARVMTAGQTETVAIASDATVEVGDAGAFAYSINGKPGKSLGDKGQVRTLKLTPATANQYTR
jgi:cytoskeleton protein RodZ